MNRFLYVCVFMICAGCSQSSMEKHQGSRDNVINIRAEVKEIMTDDALIGSYAHLYILGEYLIIADLRSSEQVIHIFDKRTLHYLLSAVNKGLGPGELANMGPIGVDEAQRRLYVSDFGKYKVFDYQIDSLIANPDSYIPKEKIKMNENLFPLDFTYFNDTLSIGVILEPIGNADYKPIVGKWNMLTGEIKLMQYEHPKITKRKRIEFAVSMEHGIYVECYSTYDLMSICSLDGELKYNIYGRKWDNYLSNTRHYGAVAICGDKIVALYSGEQEYTHTDKGEIFVAYPSKFHVFDLNGDYIKTLDTGYKISGLCYDKENKRMLMNLNDEMQFAYFDIGKYL
ncbi:hypothetical protein FACS189411_01240 [Bacteroidia bacterium]|nr:hypothetical protein FACS189411_01240 [Bacteroidia bacterium]